MEPNATANTADFEFAALNEAKNYREALIREFAPFLKGDLLEIGAGIGQITELLRQLPSTRKLVSIEPDASFCSRHRQTFPGHELVEGTVDQLPPGTAWDGVVSINVLEHIDDDEGELKKYAALLRSRKGTLCLLVPARPEIYAPIDRDFGHFRRYTRPELCRKLSGAGFQNSTICYFNLIGYFAWWLYFCVLKKRAFEAGKVRFYDRRIFPAGYSLESKVIRPPFGQSLLVIAK